MRIISGNKNYLFLKLPFSDSEFERLYFIKLRLKEVIISATDDICRYCLYHDIEVGNTGTFLLLPPTRAAFFVKWIANFKPCKLDEYVQNSSAICRRYEYGNEVLATFVASTILGLRDGKTQDSKICLLSDLIDKKELEAFLYQLKYRINHQDTLYSFFNRLYWSNSVSVGDSVPEVIP